MSSSNSLQFKTDLCYYYQSDHFMFLLLYSRIDDLSEMWTILKIKYLKIKWWIAQSLNFVVDAPSGHFHMSYCFCPTLTSPPFFFFVFFFLFPSETCFLLTFPVDYAGFSLQFGNTLLYHHARRESVYRAPVGLVVGIMADRCSDFVI